METDPASVLHKQIILILDAYFPQWYNFCGNLSNMGGEAMESCSLEICPRCGESIGQPSKYQPYGSPVRVCKTCEQTYLDDSYIELALYKKNMYQVRRIDKSSLFAAFLSFVVIILMFWALFAGSIKFLPFFGGFLIQLVIFAVAAFVVLNGLQNYSRLIKKQERERSASENRLRDPKYAWALKEIGYQVPEKYLKDRTAMSDEENFKTSTEHMDFNWD